jgi:hypothetical protein
MTKRKAHNRTNRYGTTFEVREHSFNTQSTAGNFKLTWRHGDAYINGKVTYQTTCPQCKQGVFFYKNDHGSRVFFDQLGAPWPKHGCVHGVRKMEAMIITDAQPVSKASQQQAYVEASNQADLFVDMGRVKDGVGEYNRDVRRAARDAVGIKQKKKNK